MARVTPTPLPRLDSPRIQRLGWNEISRKYRAYASILQAEDSARGPGDLVSIRVAGYLFLEFLTQSGPFDAKHSEELIRWFTPDSSQISQNVVIDIGTLLRDKLIRPFRTVTTRYSEPSSYPSNPSFDTLEDMIRDTMESTGKDYRSFRQKMLARDGYRCVITGIYDEASLERITITVPNEFRAVQLEAAHIFNESTSQGIEPAAGEESEKLYNKTYAAGGALVMLETLGFSKFADAFREAGGIHQVWNMLTLEHNLHTYFDRLNLWFEQTEKPHRYRVCTLHRRQEGLINDTFTGHDRHVDGAPIFVEFNTKHPGAPPPDPLLLAIHATCARVAHMSGAAEFFNKIERDAEEMRVLARDGSSALLLSNLLSPYAVIRGIV